MSAGKGDSPRPVNGKAYRDNYERAFRRFTELEPPVGEVVDGHKYLGNGGWHSIDLIEKSPQDDEDS